MKVYISYFYAIRFMGSGVVPVSTAVWDPKWFHDGQGKENVFVDKNGTLNGIRMEYLAPVYHECGAKECSHPKDGSCKFLQKYREQLEALNWETVKCDLELIAATAGKYLGLDKKPDVALMVYESPDNPCSERRVLQEVLPEHGITVEEWDWRKTLEFDVAGYNKVKEEFNRQNGLDY